MGALALLALALLGRALGAQEADTTAAACDGRRVVAVDFDPEPPTVIGEMAPRWARPALRIALQSRRSERSAVRPFVLLAAGDECSEFERAESERLLRAQPYLADARVTAVPDGDGVRLVVETTDDIPLIIGGAWQDDRPTRLLFGNTNVMGRGVLAAGEWQQGRAYRDGWGAHLVHYHALGGRQVAELHAVRAPLDERYEMALSRPYLTEAQHLAWSAGYVRSEGYLPFLRPGTDAISLGNTRELWGLAGLARVGSRNRRLLAGASLGHERGTPDADAVIVTDTGFLGVADTRLTAHYPAFGSTRVAGIFGTRLLAFRPVEGLDALAGRQDVASGVQLLTSLGYSRDDERGLADEDGRTEAWQPFAVVDLYAGRALRRGLTALALSIEGQRATRAGSWDDVVANGRLAWYHKPSERRTREVSLEYQGAWETRRPYRLTLGNRHAGLRGYAGSHAAGARLAVVRLEERLSLGGLGSLVGLGAAAFTDMGKLWAGDVPYGTTTSVRVSAGTGLLVAVPRRSQGLYRLDAAAPLTRDRDAPAWSLRLSRSLPYRTFLRESRELGLARRGRPAATLLASP